MMIRSRYFWMVLAGMMILAVATCGKKAPPVAPRQAPFAAVSDLKAKVVGQKVTLTWRHTIENRQATGYLVLRAQAAKDQAECLGCPQVFQKVATIRMSRSKRRQSHIQSFTQTLSGGFTYTYSVRPHHGSGAQGPGSNLLRIEVPPPPVAQ